jgi:hypothetical protein
MKKASLQTTISQVNRSFDSDDFAKIWVVDSTDVSCF